MMVSMMSDDGLWREIASTADVLFDDLSDGVGECAERSFADGICRSMAWWYVMRQQTGIENYAAMIAAVADYYSDPETRTGRMWNDISLLAREIAARIIKARKAAQ